MTCLCLGLIALLQVGSPEQEAGVTQQLAALNRSVQELVQEARTQSRFQRAQALTSVLRIDEEEAARLDAALATAKQERDETSQQVGQVRRTLAGELRPDAREHFRAALTSLSDRVPALEERIVKLERELEERRQSAAQTRSRVAELLKD